MSRFEQSRESSALEYPSERHRRDAEQWRKASMSKLRRRVAFSTTAVLLAFSLVTFAALPTEAWARSGNSHHESNQGEIYKPSIDKPSFWAKVVKAVRVHIVRPVTEVVTGGGSSPVCH